MHLDILEDKKILFVPYGKGDYYQLERMYFSDLRGNEVWDLRNLNRESVIGIPFLFMRSCILNYSGKNLVTLINLNPGLKTVFSKAKLVNKKELFYSNEFIPFLLNPDDPHEKLKKDALYHMSENCHENIFFTFALSLSDRIILSSGFKGEFVNPSQYIQKIADSVLEQCNGKIFFRCKENSSLYFLKNGKVSLPFIQSGLIDTMEFSFFLFDIELK